MNNKNNFRNYAIGSPQWVYYHGLSQLKKRKNFSAGLGKDFGGVKNPKFAFIIAKALVNDTEDTLLGKPFLRAEINWAEEFQKHLKGPNANIPFGPTSGISYCQCGQCFYRDAPREHNPKNDCQIVGSAPKKFFGFPLNIVLPKVVAGKQVGNFCPNYLDWDAE